MRKYFKRYCKTLTLKNDPELIRKYIEVHAPDNIWPEITQGMKDVGIIDMEIYLHGNQLFMIMETQANFNHHEAMTELATKPRQSEWEKYVSEFQNSDDNASADAKWQLMERIFEMDQKVTYTAIDGQLKSKD